MHCLYGLQQLGYTFQLKGGTSLSKGHKIVNRFSEDIDILIEPPASRSFDRSQLPCPFFQPRVSMDATI
jgi:predicted nucleotidyltransferase component of viral defense system